MEALPGRARVLVAGVAPASLPCLLPPPGGHVLRTVALLAALHGGCELLARSRLVGAPRPGGTFHPVLLAGAFLPVPLLLAQSSCRRYAAVRATYRRTTASLARATEAAGCTPAGHARRVAALSRAVGRDLGPSEPEPTVLEYATLMHDIGPLAARIVRVVDAYEEKSREGGPGGPLTALEELRLAASGEYAPEAVGALARALSRETEVVRAYRGRTPRVRRPGGARTGRSDPARGGVTHG